MCKTKSQKQLFAKLIAAINPSLKTRQHGIFPISNFKRPPQQSGQRKMAFGATPGICKLMKMLNHRIVTNYVKYMHKSAMEFSFFFSRKYKSRKREETFHG